MYKKTTAPICKQAFMWFYVQMWDVTQIRKDDMGCMWHGGIMIAL